MDMGQVIWRQNQANPHNSDKARDMWDILGPKNCDKDLCPKSGHNRQEWGQYQEDEGMFGKYVW